MRRRRWCAGVQWLDVLNFARPFTNALSFSFCFLCTIICQLTFNGTDGKQAREIMHKTWVRFPGLLHFNIFFPYMFRCGYDVADYHILTRSGQPRHLVGSDQGLCTGEYHGEGQQACMWLEKSTKFKEDGPGFSGLHLQIWDHTSLVISFFLSIYFILIFIY